MITSQCSAHPQMCKLSFGVLCEEFPWAYGSKPLQNGVSRSDSESPPNSFPQEIKKMEIWSVPRSSSYVYQVETSGPRMQQHQVQLAWMAVLLLVLSLCCPLHAQDNNDYITSETNVTTLDTKVLIYAPFAVFSKDDAVFTTGISIRPVYIQGPSGLYVWLSITCRGGNAQLTVPDYVANASQIKDEKSPLWSQASALNSTWTLVGLGIMMNQNISVTNNALATLAYSKATDNDIAGKATMTITLNWNVTVLNNNNTFYFTRKKNIHIWAPSALTSVTTFQATVAALCLLGIFVLCCLGCLNTRAVSSLRRISVSLARESRDQQECEQNRVFNPLWMPCTPSKPDYYNFESTPNPLLLEQRRLELKSKILRMTTPFSLMDRLMRARQLQTGKYAWVCRLPCAAAPQLPESSSDDETAGKVASKRQDSGCCLRLPSSEIVKPAIAAGETTSRKQRQPPPETALPELRRYPNPLGPSGTRNSTEPTTPNYPQQRGPPFDFGQTSQPAGNSTMKRGSREGVQLPPRNVTPTSDGEQSQAEAVVDAQKIPAAQPPVTYRSQGIGPDGNRRSNEKIVVGYAFIQHRFAQDVGMDSKNSSGQIASGSESVSPEKYGVFEAKNGHLSALPERPKGKVLHPNEILHSISSTESLDSFRSFGEVEEESLREPARA